MYMPIHVNDLVYHILGKEAISRENITKISKALDVITKLEFIKSEKIAKNTYIFDTDSMNHIPKYYVWTPFFYLNKILVSEYSYKFNLVKQYFLILGGRRYGGELNFMSLNWFAEKMNCSIQTINCYNTALEKLKLICIYKSNNKKIGNIYASFDDADILSMYVENQNLSNVSKKTNINRSLIMKYNYIVKSGKCPYSQKEVREIRKAIIEHNSQAETYKERFPGTVVKFYDPAILEPYLT